jgi:hypothetical protein
LSTIGPCEQPADSPQGEAEEFDGGRKEIAPEGGKIAARTSDSQFWGKV